MDRFFFGYSAGKDNKFIDYAPTADSQDSNYPTSNLKDYHHLKRQWRSLVATEVKIVCDMASAKNLLGVMIEDVNFTSVYIEGSNDNVTYPFTQSFAISNDERVDRYKAYCVLTGFNYRYLRIRIPAQTPTDGLPAFRLGRILLIDSIIELPINLSYPYEYEAPKRYKKVEFESGGVEKINFGSNKIWRCDFGISRFVRDTGGTTLWQLDAIDEDQLVVFFENRGDTSKAYVVMRDNSLKVSETFFNIGKTSNYEFQEVV